MIEARHLTTRYGAEALALDDVSFHVGRGEIYCLLGATGAGKSTVIRAFLATVELTQGDARIDGVDCATSPLAARARAAFITPDMGLHPTLSARRNVEFFASLSEGVRVTRAAVDNAMRSVGIAERHFDRAIRDLGKDTRVLLWLAVAGLRQAPAIVLDEPTAGLDAHTANDVHECLRDLREQDKAVLVATSEVLLATQLADRIGLLSSGRKTSERTRQELLGQNLTQFSLEFAGHPAVRTAASLNP